MKHKLPALEQLMKTDLTLLDDVHTYPAVRPDHSLVSLIPLFRKHERILVKDQSGCLLGYLEKSDVLEAVLESYLYLEAYFHTILQTMDASVTVIDENANIVVWTQGAEQIFSLKAEEAIGRPITRFFPPEMIQTLKTLRTGESVYRRQHQPREDLFVLINTNPVRLNNRIVGAVAAETDITSQVRLNQELYNATRKVHHLQQEMAKLSPASDPFASIKGTSPAIRQIKELIRKLGTTSAPVLFLGESGVGKELFAKATHDIREKAGAPFIAINCGAIPPTLFESELFGYEKGAFSGADQKGKKGMIELARGGTLFLDEIGEMPLDMQVKLLRVLQEKKYYAVGGTRQIEADFRVIAATNKDLEALVKEGRFREDLFYRLNVVTIKIPPLRERIEDIIELTHYFLYEFSLLYGRAIQGVSQTVMQDLLHYSWPGNIRELRNTIERLVVFATDGIIKEEDLPFSVQARQKNVPPAFAGGRMALQEELDQHERQVILLALEQENGNKQAAAKRLGISRATLYNKMHKLKIPFS
ncbi:sigma 54-interacting transcriptional regulator [Brevibacillus sp. SYP-B805]|uniref:sigma-54 interaction domain-containing protein n=1 Tax=Brevibacillus sp. SYP-B805 TaxID=1578199 RepID=UPI0013EAA790|nr:sigma 54-interacting transcriptional regulator [Brevibacillus sp. SYP-B805]NGQ97442.1 sigma 54-interacting transcriptional regulator [Brevibacillus sp. SYP-B805]